MIHTIEIVQETGNQALSRYRAIRGRQQAHGATAGQALDSLEEKIATEPEADEGTLVIVQRFQPDEFFPARRQVRLQELMTRFQEAINADEELSAAEKQELEQLVGAEWQAAIDRAAAIIAQSHRSSS